MIIKYIINRILIALNLFIGYILTLFSLIISELTKKQVRNAHKPNIIVSQIFEIGDMVLTLPFIRNIKLNYPNSKVTLICGDWAVSIGRLSSDVNNILIYNSIAARRVNKINLKDIIYQIKEITRLKCDIFFDIRGDFFITIAVLNLFLKNPRMRYYNRSIISFQDKMKSIFTHKSPMHEVTKQLCLLLKAGGKIEKADILLKYPNHVGEYTEFLSDYIIFHLGAGWEYRTLPSETSLKIIDLLLEKTSLNIVLTGSESDLKIKNVSKVVNSLPISRRIINLIGKTTFEEIFLLISKSLLLIGPDTSVTHLAGILGIPTVALYGPNDPRKIGPYFFKENSFIIYHKLECSPCKQIKCVSPNNYCMMYISPYEVVEKALHLLKYETR